MATVVTESTTDIPEPKDADLARVSAQALASRLAGNPKRVAIRFVDASPDVIELPLPAVRLLIELLNEMAQGNSVSLISTHAELATQYAADLINVSRGFLVKLLERQEIPHRKVGTHRRVMFSDLKAYDTRSRRERSKALDELAAVGQALGLGYD